METSDPVLRELQSLRKQSRRMLLYSLVLISYVVVATGVAMWIRSNDLETIARRQAVATVSSCFRDATRRPALLEVVFDERSSQSARDLARTELAKTPRVSYCRALADRLNVHRQTEDLPR